MTDAAAAELIERIYDAVLEENGWGTLVGDLVEAFHGNQAVLLSQDERSGLARVRAHTVGVSEEALHAYETHYGPRSPLFHYFKTVPLGLPYSDTDYPDQALYRRSEIYNELYRPNAAEHLLGIDLERTTGLSTYLIVRRGGRTGVFDRSDAERLAGLGRHLARALQLGRLVEGAEHTAAALETLLARLPAPVLLADAGGRVVFLNPRAERLVRAGDGLTLSHGRLRCSRPADGQALARLLAGVADGPPDSAGGLVAVHRRGAATPLMVEVLPLPAGFGAAHGRRLALLRVADPRAPGPEPAVIARLLGLTAAEAAVTAALCGGESIAAYAARTGISPHTARTLLRNAMAKTETHRQAALVGRVMALLAGRLDSD